MPYPNSAPRARARHPRAGRPLTAAEKAALAPHIPAGDLDAVRIKGHGLPWYMAPLGQVIGLTRGRTIHFRRGACDTRTADGLALLAHELVHVGQYRSGMTAWSYLLELAWRGYRRHRRELPAYGLEARVRAALVAAGYPRATGARPARRARPRPMPQGGPMHGTKLWPALAIAAALAFVAACATNPVTGRRELSLVSPGQEKTLGLQGYNETIQQYGKYDDADLQAYVNQVGQKVAHASHQPDLGWTFTLIDDPSVNAFAMPGGYIFVTRGILPYLDSEAQLAGVLGHECGHVTHRHTAEQMTQQQLYGLGLGIASATSSTFRQFGGVAQQALGLLFLRYSRQDETEADELGVQYSTRAGYDSRQMPLTYAMLKRVGDKSGQRLPGFLSTHPDPGDREQRTTQLSQRATAGKSGLLVVRDPYIRRMNNIVYGSDPRHGYFTGDRYVNPSLAFEVTFPSGWQHQDTQQAVTAGKSDQSAAMQVSIADAKGATPGAYVDQLQAAGKIAARRGQLESVGGLPAWVGHVEVAGQNSQGQAVQATLAAAFIRKDDRMFQILGASSGGDDDQREFDSMRSFRNVSDPALLDVRPDRVRVQEAPVGGSFASVVQRMGSRAADVDDDAILNDVQPGDRIAAGTLLKVIIRGR